MMWLAVVAVDVGSFALRISILVVPDSLVSVRWDRSLQAVAPAVIASLVVSDLVVGVESGGGWLEIVACLAAVAVARWRDSLMAAAYVGMAILWVPLLAG